MKRVHIALLVPVASSAVNRYCKKATARTLEASFQATACSVPPAVAIVRFFWIVESPRAACGVLATSCFVTHFACACARHCFWLACRRVARTCGCKMSVPMTPQGATGRRAWLLANTCVHQMTVQCLSMGCLRAGGALSCPRQRCHARALAPPPQPVLCYTILIVVFAIQMERKLMLYSSQDSSCSRSCARPWGARRRACIPRQRMLLT